MGRCKLEYKVKLTYLNKDDNSNEIIKIYTANPEWDMDAMQKSWKNYKPFRYEILGVVSNL